MTGGPEKLRVGVIGTGAISQVVHVPIFVEREDVEVVALADVDPHKAETLSRRFDVPLVMDAEELIDLESLDAVVVCTPNAFHEQFALAALEAGRHVLVERPMALSREGAERVLAKAREVERTLAVGMPHRFRPGVAALRDFVEGGELGDIKTVSGGWMTRPAPGTRSRWRQDPGVAGGGALMDLGIAALDLCLWVIGYPEIRRLVCILDRERDSVEESASLMAETVDGAALTLEVSTRLFGGHDRFFARVMGSEGSGSLPPLEVFKQLGGRPMDVTPRQPRPRGGENLYTNAYRRLLDDFVRRATGRADFELPTEQPALMGLIEAAYRSAETGREVEP